ncbi:MAG: protein-methionine-sulfoxide reductase heme-binding subunit MsrQ [Alphaproteobacteria bacterium]|nr:protein-methionine-sulfoxide reductase heme-binding subunit MsrQ [Alphaproteobacteria bacterium]
MRILPAATRHPLFKPALFLLCLGPLVALGLRFPDELGVNPIETLNRTTGQWAMRFLLLTLAVTPLARLTRTPGLMRIRRMIGLFAFFYVCLHLSSYVGLDQFFDMSAIWADIIKRTFITLGFAAFVLLVPLAITSTRKMQKRLGAKVWSRLHKLIYPAAILVIFHFTMMTKADFREPIIYGLILAGLLGWRASRALHRRMSAQRTDQQTA